MERHLDPISITVEVDGKTYTAQLRLVQDGKVFSYSISFGDQTRKHSKMPSVWHCEHHGKMELMEMIRQSKEQPKKS